MDLVGLLLELPNFHSSFTAAPAISSREDFQVPSRRARSRILLTCIIKHTSCPSRLTHERCFGALLRLQPLCNPPPSHGSSSSVGLSARMKTPAAPTNGTTCWRVQ